MSASINRLQLAALSKRAAALAAKLAKTASTIATDIPRKGGSEAISRRDVALNTVLGLGGLHSLHDLTGPQWRPPGSGRFVTPIQASPLPSALIGTWLWNNQGTPGDGFLHIQRMVVYINLDTTGEVIFATQQSEVGGNGCTVTSTGTFPGGNWFVNGQALSLTVPESTFTNVFTCTPGQNSTSHGFNGVFTFHTFAVNGNSMVVTPPADLNIHDFEASFGAPVLTSITLHRIAGPSAPSTSPSPLVASVLPSSRSVQVGRPATAFATIINSGSTVATGCAITPVTTIPANFAFQTTNPTTNELTGSLNTPVDIAAGASQSYVFAVSPTAPFNPTNVVLGFTSKNTDPAQTISGVNTLLLSASATPVPDIVALAATATNDGIVDIPGPSGTGAFAVATVNVGASSAITATANTGNTSLPLTISLCQTDPQSGQCISATGSSVTFQDNAGATPTVAVFVTGNGTVPFDAANNRIFVEFLDPSGTVRGATSVAVRTQ
jgi:hypothetical protein